MLEALVTGGDAVLGTEGKGIRFSGGGGGGLLLFVGFIQVIFKFLVCLFEESCSFDVRAAFFHAHLWCGRAWREA